MIRMAEEKDIPGIQALLFQVNRVHHEGRPDLFRGPVTKYSPEELKRMLGKAEAPVFVWEEEGRILAHCFCQFQQTRDDSLRTDVKALYIDDLCVDEGCRGRGIGRKMFDYVRTYAQGAGCYHVTLNVWTLNPGALQFYRRCGMSPYKVGMEFILEGDGR